VLGYDASIIQHRESGRTAISKRYLDVVKIISNENVNIFFPIINKELPLVGIEPSTLLTFRDEYPRLVDNSLKEKAIKLQENVFLIDEFLASEFDKGNISEDQFTDEKLDIALHGHCHQKALSSVTFTKKILNIPKHYSTLVIPSGCCGMAGSFGYEHFDVSMKIGELVLFPAIRNKASNTVIAAPGTSCRQQIKDGVNEKALHPVEILWKAVLK
jgi:Fe-S oxidoreductase